MSFYIHYHILFTEPKPPTENPCEPSPCGPNALCQVRGDSPACSCLPNYIGIPPNCRPECLINPECASQLACVNQKCRDPCPGSCGQHATCAVINHNPVCTCIPGFVGDPFIGCSEAIGKLFFPIYNTFLTISMLYHQHALQFHDICLNHVTNRTMPVLHGTTFSLDSFEDT